MPMRADPEDIALNLKKAETDRNGVAYRMSAVGEKPVEAARQLSGPRFSPAYGRSVGESGHWLALI